MMLWALRKRETASPSPPAWQRSTMVHHSLVDRLRMTQRLRGHEGCVNHISFNDDGSKLVSGGDDTDLCIWDTTGRGSGAAALCCGPVPTPHSANIFCTRFMPCSGDQKVASCAGDSRVVVTSLPDCCSGGGGTRAFTVLQHHEDRVKKLVVEPGNPHTIVSGSEDGTVRQVDLRLPQPGAKSQLLVKLVQYHLQNAAGGNGRAVAGPSHGGPFLSLEINSIAAPELRPWLLAVGADDQVVRVFDRRMPRQAVAELFPDRASERDAAVLRFRTGHSMATCSALEPDGTGVTGVACSADGSRVLASYSHGAVICYWAAAGRQQRMQRDAPPPTRRRRQNDHAAGPTAAGAATTAAGPAAAAGNEGGGGATDRTGQQQQQRGGGQQQQQQEEEQWQGGQQQQRGGGQQQQRGGGQQQEQRRPHLSDLVWPPSGTASGTAAAAGAPGVHALPGSSSAGGSAEWQATAVRMRAVLAAIEEVPVPRRRRRMTAELLCRLSAAALHEGDAGVAAGLARSAVQLRPSLGLAHYHAARAAEASGDLEQARQHTQTALAQTCNSQLDALAARLGLRDSMLASDDDNDDDDDEGGDDEGGDEDAMVDNGGGEEEEEEEGEDVGGGRAASRGQKGDTADGGAEEQVEEEETGRAGVGRATSRVTLEALREQRRVSGGGGGAGGSSSGSESENSAGSEAARRGWQRGLRRLERSLGIAAAAAAAADARGEDDRMVGVDSDGAGDAEASDEGGTVPPGYWQIWDDEDTRRREEGEADEGGEEEEEGEDEEGEEEDDMYSDESDFPDFGEANSPEGSWSNAVQRLAYDLLSGSSNSSGGTSSSPASSSGQARDAAATVRGSSGYFDDGINITGSSSSSSDSDVEGSSGDMDMGSVDSWGEHLGRLLLDNMDGPGASSSGGQHGDGGSMAGAREEVLGSRVMQRYRGHANRRTVKDVSFLGPYDSLVASGSDDGRLFIWDAESGQVLTALRGDMFAINVVACAPHRLLLASCGIDRSVKLYEPVGRVRTLEGVAKWRRRLAIAAGRNALAL